MFSQLTFVIDQWHCVTLGGYRGQSGDDLNAKLTTVCPSAKSVSEDSVAEGVQSAVKNADKMTLCWYLDLSTPWESF